MRRMAEHRSHMQRGNQYDALLAHQHGGCAICGRPQKFSNYRHRARRLVFYFARVGGEATRLLLCLRCNRGLEAFRDSPLLLSRALACITLGEVATKFEAVNGVPILPLAPPPEEEDAAALDVASASSLPAP